MTKSPKLFVFGIDGAPPEYIFDKWLDELPNIKKLMEEGTYAKLVSTTPPLSIVAWGSIYTGKSPGDHGIFEYIHRKNYVYDDIRVMTSRNLRAKTIWEILSDNDKKSVVSFFINTWPVRPFKGHIVCGPYVPSGDKVQITHPPELLDELEKNLGEKLLLDIPPDFRDKNKDELLESAYKVTKQHFSTMKYLLKNKEWDFFFTIAGTSDRLNHMFWRDMDPEHRKHDPNSKFKYTLLNYYKYIDKELGEMISMLDKDTKIIVLSDHGIMRMHTRVNLTDWLIKEGYLVLKQPLTGKTKFSPSLVDWRKTKVFAIGAYEGQIFVNLKGREPEGIVEEQEYEKLLDELSEKLKKIPGDDDSELNTKCFKKSDHIKGAQEHIAPDMIVYFDDLQYGCNNSLIGNTKLHSLETAKGSDDACHSKKGIFIIKNNRHNEGYIGEIDSLDVTPTILNELGFAVPQELKGKVIAK